MLSWIGRGAPSAAAALTPDRELADLNDALEATKLIMEDKFDEVEVVLNAKTSPFHRYMRTMSLFLRAILAVEPETIKKGLAVAAEAERVAYEYVLYTQQHPSSTHQSGQHPPGTVYQFMHAELQFLYSVFAIMSANVSDALKALLRIRKGYATMQQLYKSKQDASLKIEAANGRAGSSASRRSFDFAFAGEDSTSSSAHPIDHFLHTGLCFCYGILSWALSIVPAPWDKVLSYMSYTGDRKLGHSLMWEASKYPATIHGALAGYTTVVLYNGLSARCDIRLSDAVPFEKIEEVLVSLEEHYPRSHKWAIQRNLMLAVHDRNCVLARQVLQPGIEDAEALKFVKALCLFEQGSKCLFLHDYEGTADSFTEVAKYTDWSYSLFNFIVGISYVDAYRFALKSDDARAKEYSSKASKALQRSMDGLCARKILGKPVPMEVYIRSNMNRYLAKAAAQKVDLVDAVDVSPAQELTWLWGGFDCMQLEQLSRSLETIDLYETSIKEELARKALLKAACLRAMQRHADAREMLEKEVLCYTAADIRTWDKHAANWLLPAAHFDAAVCLWWEAGQEKKDKDKLQACAEHIRIASRWGASDFQSIMGIKISTALEAVKKMGVSR